MIGKMRDVLILMSALSIALVPLTEAWASGGGGHGGDVNVPVASMVMGFINLGLLICLLVFAYKKIGKAYRSAALAATSLEISIVSSRLIFFTGINGTTSTAPIRGCWP